MQSLDKGGVLHEGQAGFRVNRSCMDNVYSLHDNNITICVTPPYILLRGVTHVVIVACNYQLSAYMNCLW